ncbi:hypothetical protein [Salipiger sp.]|uniref:hypothetical protein n=1 Tax=Salipiger sp. TaxID=2078585 RepID=UPI003A977E21
MTAALDVPGAMLRSRDLLALRDIALASHTPWSPCQAMLVADFRPSMLRGLIRAFRSVAAAEALVLVGWRVTEAGGQVGLLAVGSGAPVLVAPSSGAGAMQEVITGLVRAHDLAAANAMAGCLDDPPLDRSLVSLDRLTTDGELIIASGFETPGAALSRRLGMLSHTHVLRLIRITDLSFTGEVQDDPEAPELPGVSAISLDACLPPDAIARVLRPDWSQPR